MKSNIEELLKEGLKNLEKGNFSECINKCKEVIGSDKNNYKALYMLFLAYNSKKSLDECNTADYDDCKEYFDMAYNNAKEEMKIELDKYKEKVEEINKFESKIKSIINSKNNIQKYSKFAEDGVGENVNVAYDLAIKKEIIKDRNSLVKNEYNNTISKIKLILDDIYESGIINEINEYIDYKNKKDVEINNDEKSLENEDKSYKNTKSKTEDLKKIYEALKTEKSTIEKNIVDTNNRLKFMMQEIEALENEKIDCGEKIKIYNEIKVEYDEKNKEYINVKSNYEKLKEIYNTAKDEYNNKLLILEAELKKHDTDKEYANIIEQENKLLKEKEDSAIMPEKKDMIDMQLMDIAKNKKIYEDNKIAYKETKENIENVRKTYIDEKSNKEAEINEIEKDIKIRENILGDLKNKLDFNNKEKRLTEIENKIKEMKNEIEKKEKDIEKYKEIVESDEQKIITSNEDLQKNIEEEKEKEVLLSEEKNKLKKQKEELTEYFEKLIKNIKAIKIRKNDIEKQIKDELCVIDAKIENVEGLYKKFNDKGIFNEAIKEYAIKEQLNKTVSGLAKEKMINDVNEYVKTINEDIEKFDNNISYYQKEEKYVRAKDLLHVKNNEKKINVNTNELKEARELFSEILDYKDSKDLMDMTTYYLGVALIGKRAKEAKKYLSTIPDYKDVKDLLIRCDVEIKIQHEKFLGRIKMFFVLIVLLIIAAAIIILLDKLGIVKTGILDKIGTLR